MRGGKSRSIPKSTAPADPVDVTLLSMRGEWMLLLFGLACGRSAQPPTPLQDSAEDFEPFGEPQPGDWQYRFRESAQTFEDYVASSPNRKSVARHTFYIQPLGDLSDKARSAIALMREYAEIFFGVPAKVREPAPLPPNAYVKSRAQYDASRIIDWLSDRIPADALVYIGITNEDLFSEGLNFVFGQGSLQDRTGVYSLHRYETPDAALHLRRALKLMSHEVGHIFSIHHCVTYQCVMNGANSLAEDDRHPMNLCPIDLRKLEWNLGFDRVGRYRKLLDFYRKQELTAEADWTDRHLKKGSR